MPEKKKILVIEDDHLIMQRLVDLLCHEGFDAVGVGDGYGVLNKIRDNPDTADVRFAFLTGRSQENQIRSALAMGADGYLTKPFNVPSLLRLIHHLLEPGRV